MILRESMGAAGITKMKLYNCYNLASRYTQGPCDEMSQRTHCNLSY